MHRISPVSIFWVAILTVAMVGCGSESGGRTITVGATNTVHKNYSDKTVCESAKYSMGYEEPTTTVDDRADYAMEDYASTETSEGAEQNAEIAAVCDA